MIDTHATAQTKARYNRIARVYDLMEAMAERTFKPWREKLWGLVRGDILEVGVGTGKNFPYHPRGARVVGIDLADQMLARARALGAAIDLREGDA
jgi:ubiquinone/menaquinone biosynthesis C-methylase UbiE